MIRRPGMLLIIMMWWTMPFFIRDMLTYNSYKYLSSYLTYIIGWSVAIICGTLLNLIESKWIPWNSMRYWGKYATIMMAYIVTVIVIVSIIIILDEYRIVEYFGGDAGGSFGLLYGPSILGYIILGLIGSRLLNRKRTGMS
jgi:hypothetical protein